MPLEVTIPMTGEMALKMFNIEDNYPDLKDYEPEYVVEYPESGQE